MSIERSKKASSREETVSQVRHRVSLVRTPSNSRCTIVDDDEFDRVEAGSDTRELETEKRVFSYGTVLGAQEGTISTHDRIPAYSFASPRFPPQSCSADN